MARLIDADKKASELGAIAKAYHNLADAAMKNGMLGFAKTMNTVGCTFDCARKMIMEEQGDESTSDYGQA